MPEASPSLAPAAAAEKTSAAAAGVAHSAVLSGQQRRRVLALAIAGHFVTDLAQGALPALITHFVADAGWTYAMGTSLILAANVGSSVLQPLFGWWSDKRPASWLVGAGAMLAALGAALASGLTDYTTVLAILAVAGVGIAAFHPEGARWVYRAEPGSAKAMSWFAAGGNLGFACGPVYTTWVLTMGQPAAMGLLLLPALLLLGVLAWQREALAPLGQVAHNARAMAGERDDWFQFGLLSAGVFFRAIAFTGLMTFIPLHWLRDFHMNKAEASFAAATFLMAGVMGTFLGGWASERFSRKGFVVVALTAATVLQVVLLQVESPRLAALLILPIGLSFYSPFSILVAFGQRYLPRHVGVASGVTLGLGVAVGGTVAPLLGRLADSQGIPAAMAMIAAMTLGSLVLTFPLRDPFLPQRGK